MRFLTFSSLMHQRQDVAVHCHGNYEFHYIAYGSGGFAIDGGEHDVEEGNFFYTRPREAHRIFRKDKSRYLFQYLCHADGLPEGIIGLMDTRADTGRFYALPGLKAVWERWSMLYASGMPFGLQALEHQFLGFLFETLASEASPYPKNAEALSKDGLVLERALEYVQERIDRPFSLDNLAERAGCDKFQLIRLFKKRFGLTPAKYWTRLKVEGAVAQLADPSLKLRSIADRFGFSDEFHLSRTVKLWTGRSPQEIRKFGSGDRQGPGAPKGEGS